MRLHWVIGFCLLAAAAAASPVDEYVEYSGVATVRHTTTFLYGERHILHYHDGKLTERAVLYSCADGSSFARKSVHYDNTLAPDFRLEDKATGLLQGIRSKDGARTVFFRSNANGQDKEGPLPSAPGLVADAGFEEFVQVHWSQLQAGETLSMRFLVPSRLDAYGFQVQHLRSERIDGVPTEVIRLRLSNIWGWFLPSIDAYYSTTDHLLVHYDGLSDLQDMAGNNYKVEISYKPANRHPSDDRALQASLAAPLSACR